MPSMPGPERVAIVGLGLIGGSLALALRRARPDVRIIGVDIDARTRELADAERAVDHSSTLEDAALANCDTVVLCTPAQPLLEIFPEVVSRMRPGALLTDVCGAKERVCAEGAAQDRVVFIGAHPMAGTEFRGFVSANPALFFGCTVALCPPVGAPDLRLRRDAIRRVRELWTAAGAEKLLDIEADAHDRAVTVASHLPYLAAAAVAQALIGWQATARSEAPPRSTASFRARRASWRNGCAPSRSSWNKAPTRRCSSSPPWRTSGAGCAFRARQRAGEGRPHPLNRRCDGRRSCSTTGPDAFGRRPVPRVPRRWRARAAGPGSTARSAGPRSGDPHTAAADRRRPPRLSRRSQRGRARRPPGRRRRAGIPRQPRHRRSPTAGVR